jgi:hypothetical protein
MSNDKPYPPLITPRSPSYERAGQEFLGSSERDARSKQVALGVLSELCDAERDASDVCSKISALLTDDDLAEVVRDRGELHDARRQGIGKLIEQLGGSPPASDSSRPILVQTLDSISRTNADAMPEQSLALLHKELSAVYQAAMSNENLDQEQRSALATFAPSDQQAESRA